MSDGGADCHMKLSERGAGHGQPIERHPPVEPRRDSGAAKSFWHDGENAMISPSALFDIALKHPVTRMRRALYLCIIVCNNAFHIVVVYSDIGAV